MMMIVMMMMMMMMMMFDNDDYDDDDDCDDEVFCRRLIKTMITVYGLRVCMHAFVDICMYVFIISFYRHIDYCI